MKKFDSTFTHQEHKDENMSNQYEENLAANQAHMREVRYDQMVERQQQEKEEKMANRINDDLAERTLSETIAIAMGEKDHYIQQYGNCNISINGACIFDEKRVLHDAAIIQQS